jgi:2'-5' RNA ligase
MMPPGEGPGEETRVRCFIAVDLAPTVHTRIDEVVTVLRACGGDVRWIAAGNLHVTLAFLGVVPASRLAPIGRVLERVAADTAPFDLQARGLGAFPNPRRARVVWVGIESAALPAVARRVHAGLAEEGFAPDARAFTPHVTIGRVRGPRGWERVRGSMEPYMRHDFGGTRIEEMTLYRSELTHQGTRYTPLERVHLGGRG